MFSSDLGIFSTSVARQSNFEKALASYCAAPSAEKLTYAWHRACYPLATQPTTSSLHDICIFIILKVDLMKRCI